MAFAQRLRDDPVLFAKGEELKTELLAHPEVRAWLGSLWAEMKRNTISALDDPTASCASVSIDRWSNLGRRLASDAELQAKVDDWVARAAGHIVDHYRGEVADLISGTVGQVGCQGHRRTTRATGRPRPAVHPHQRHDRRRPRRPGDLLGQPAAVLTHGQSRRVGGMPESPESVGTTPSTW